MQMNENNLMKAELIGMLDSFNPRFRDGVVTYTIDGFQIHMPSGLYGLLKETETEMEKHFIEQMGIPLDELVKEMEQEDE